MKSALTIFIVLFVTVSMIGQTSKKEKDIEAIKAMQGCYDVEFKYTETFSPDVDYEKAYDYTSQAKELAMIIYEDDNQIILQHLLVIHDSMIIKHWRQDWTYEDSVRLDYNKDFTWNKIRISPEQTAGTWTQEVFQVDDSPRYSGTATWTHVDGISKWESKNNSPLPRREYSKRSDYNVMKRGNTVIITDYGWLHEQDNDKIIRNEEGDRLLAQEKGYNTYKKIDDLECEIAKQWWKENKELWTEVRNTWNNVFDTHDLLSLNNKVEDKFLYEHLFYAQEKIESDRIKELINLYVK